MIETESLLLISSNIIRWLFTWNSGTHGAPEFLVGNFP